MFAKKWKLYLIVLASVLTVYNILPTIFYYSKPLNKDIDKKSAYKIQKEAINRVNILEKKAIDWTKSYLKLLNIKYKSISPYLSDKIEIIFKNKEDAKKFAKYVPRAAALIPFAPSRLSISKDLSFDKKIILQREIPCKIENKNFEFAFNFKKNKTPSSLYKKITFDKVAAITAVLAQKHENSYLLGSLQTFDTTFAICKKIVNYFELFQKNPKVLHRFLSSFTQNITLSKLDLLIKEIEFKRKRMQLDENKNDLNKRKEMILIKANKILKEQRAKFSSKENFYTYNKALSLLEEQRDKEEVIIDLGNKNPIFKKIILNWDKEKIFLYMHEDLENLLKTSLQKEKIKKLLFDEIAKIKIKTSEEISKDLVINLNTLSKSKSFLVLKLDEIAKVQKNQIQKIIEEKWEAVNPEINLQNFPIYDFQAYEKLPKEKKVLCFVVYAPSIDENILSNRIKKDSIYVIAKGLNRISQKYQNIQTQKAKQFSSDFHRLKELFYENGFLGYPGLYLQSEEFKNDIIFEKENFYQTILKATRENFEVRGNKKFAVLEFSNVEQRILTTNKIEDEIHEDLLKWQDEYKAAGIDLATKYDIAKPTENVLLANFKLSFKKYFQGDNRKILHWGLDLSGGKTLQIELVDQNNKIVKNSFDIKQGADELYNRVNKMGVSNVNIRSIDSSIILDFPGAQNIAAKDLIKSSSMYFHVVNEKFSFKNPDLKEIVNNFCQDVYNEAVVTNKKDAESINQIALKHLLGESLNPNFPEPISEDAKILLENGLMLASKENKSSSSFDNKLSKIAIFKGSNYLKWDHQTHPLLIVFNNYALEGVNLKNIKSGYSPQEGNFLSFQITGKNKEGKSAKKVLYTWTSTYYKNKILESELKNFSHNQGWRMAVILNDFIVSSPILDEAIQQQAKISGNFSQREVNKLKADLKAGSLSFSPRILSEKNISPELGSKERSRGILATILALVAIIIAIVSYYRFAGVVASIAVLFNLLIMWGALQNIQATLTLASIAAIILSIGMAVDANVLVFERIKEEFFKTNKLDFSVKAGYKKAYSAILDSNITTIIAALILLHFDSGPIKGFAITLIIGIISSMFSALFMTKYFFQKWVQNPKHQTLKMSNLIKETNFNFLKKAKYLFIFSILITIFGIFSIHKSILSIDFTGGNALNIELIGSLKNYRPLVEKAFIKNGASLQDFQVRQLDKPNSLRLFFSTNMELKNKPFYQKNISSKKIEWIIESLKTQNLNIKNISSLKQSWTSMSGQMSNQMRNNAILSIILALIAVFIYITFRFEFRFAISAMFCLFYDVFITFFTISILNRLHVPINLDLHTIAAFMTIIGYSLNDTIIIFDRIREDMKFMTKYTFKEIINHSLNTTLPRTFMTSFTTFLVLLILVIFAGPTIFNFAFVMILGIIYGTLSSLFIASPLLILFSKKTLVDN